MEPTSLPDAGKIDEDAPMQNLVERYLTVRGESPYDQVEWETRDAVPGGDENKRLRDAEVPSSWSQQALDIAAKLYFAKSDDYVETSVRQLINRVCHKIAVQGARAGYFGYGEWSELSGLGNQAFLFYNELSAICLQQLATFNSPVWFNIGRDDRPQCPSACFILDVQDTTESIYDWYRDEASIFKSGSGSGVNLSAIRGSMETLSTGGIASGPVSFMRPSNSGAETIKSGGTTRRAAKIVQLDADHPDIVDFIDSKPREEERLEILGKAGINIGFDAEGERNVAEVTSFQSANNSVRVTDEFMRQAIDRHDRAEWALRPRKGGYTTTVSAGSLLDQMAAAVYSCADPGIMFHDTINSWHTTPNDASIDCTNPCGELHTPNTSSCNLASINVLKFVDEEMKVDVAKLRHVVDVMTLAMDILVDFCELPTEALTRRTKEYRWLGLGFSNMGAAIMAQGLPYDSAMGRDFAASFMALETGRAYRMSAMVAERLAPFDGFAENRDVMLDVMDRHHSFLPSDDPTDLWQAAREDWLDVLVMGHKHGYRNAQATVIAPAGTTSFFLDCDTTGIEPAFSLVTHKQLAGGGSMKLVNRSVRRAAEALGGYSEDNLKSLATGDTSCISPEDLAVFAGANDISAEGHVKMLAAVQPFLSGAASKTINLPETATVEEIKDCFALAWRLGVKCVAVYRNNSKVRQVLSSKPKADDSPNVGWTTSGDSSDLVEVTPVHQPVRKRLPRTRQSITHKIHVRGQLGEHEGYVTVGMYPDGTLGEMFLEGFGRLGGFTQNVLSAWATSVSVSLQYGVPLEVQMRKHVGHCDETGGIVVPATGEPLVIRSCDSIIDYIAKWVIAQFGAVDLQEELGVMTDAVKARKMSLVDSATGTLSGISPSVPLAWNPTESNPVRDAVAMLGLVSTNGHAKTVEMSAHECPDCHSPLKPAGSCWSCTCGYTTGCG